MSLLVPVRVANLVMSPGNCCVHNLGAMEKAYRGRRLSTREKREKCREFVAENRVGASSPVASSPLQLLLVIPNLKANGDGSQVARFLLVCGWVRISP